MESQTYPESRLYTTTFSNCPMPAAYQFASQFGSFTASPTVTLAKSYRLSLYRSLGLDPLVAPKS